MANELKTLEDVCEALDTFVERHCISHDAHAELQEIEDVVRNAVERYGYAYDAANKCWLQKPCRVLLNGDEWHRVLTADTKRGVITYRSMDDKDSTIYTAFGVVTLEPIIDHHQV